MSFKSIILDKEINLHLKKMNENTKERSFDNFNSEELSRYLDLIMQEPPKNCCDSLENIYYIIFKYEKCVLSYVTECQVQRILFLAQFEQNRLFGFRILALLMKISSDFSTMVYSSSNIKDIIEIIKIGDSDEVLYECFDFTYNLIESLKSNQGEHDPPFISVLLETKFLDHIIDFFYIENKDIVNICFNILSSLIEYECFHCLIITKFKSFTPAHDDSVFLFSLFILSQMLDEHGYDSISEYLLSDDILNFIKNILDDSSTKIPDALSAIRICTSIVCFGDSTIVLFSENGIFNSIMSLLLNLEDEELHSSILSLIQSMVISAEESISNVFELIMSFNWTAYSDDKSFQIKSIVGEIVLSFLRLSPTSILDNESYIELLKLVCNIYGSGDNSFNIIFSDSMAKLLTDLESHQNIYDKIIYTLSSSDIDLCDILNKNY